ncbi:hypothetical protein ANN_15147 [Periplaneta americana]|uniref:Per a allergen n=1 Tax=Periplaneta americana TaxID=6978 RepID=A0ABQ8SZW2_PERAM|nr:hypothetical protein ANN_15147 [Periplaneta americana]
MAGLCEGGNEPPGSLKASNFPKDPEVKAVRTPPVVVAAQFVPVTSGRKIWIARPYHRKGAVLYVFAP